MLGSMIMKRRENMKYGNKSVLVFLIKDSFKVFLLFIDKSPDIIKKVGTQ